MEDEAADCSGVKQHQELQELGDQWQLPVREILQVQVIGPVSLQCCVTVLFSCTAALIESCEQALVPCSCGGKRQSNKLQCAQCWSAKKKNCTSEHAGSPAATPEQLNNNTHSYPRTANLNCAAPKNQAASSALAADAEKKARVAADAEKKAMVAVRKKQQTAGAIPRSNGSAPPNTLHMWNINLKTQRGTMALFSCAVTCPT